MQDVTGRDSYILTKALMYAVAAIDALPADQQESSDRDDMVQLLIARMPDPVEREALARTIQAHTGISPDITNWKAAPG